MVRKVGDSGQCEFKECKESGEVRCSVVSTSTDVQGAKSMT
jgi:hypothetical protein